MPNGLKTALLLGALSGMLLLLGDLLGGQQGLILAFGFAAVMNLGSYWFSDKIVLRMYNAQQVDASHPLYQMTQRLAIKAGLPMPKVYIIPDSSPNAFATGRNPEHAAVAATQGIMQVLSAARARRGHCARAGARQASRHPDQLGRGDDCRRGHDARAHGDVCRHVRRRPRRSRGRDQPDRAARDDDPRADCGDADSDGDLAIAGVRRRRRRGARSPATRTRWPTRCGRSTPSPSACRSTPTRRRRTCSS